MVPLEPQYKRAFGRPLGWLMDESFTMSRAGLVYVSLSYVGGGEAFWKALQEFVPKQKVDLEEPICMIE